MVQKILIKLRQWYNNIAKERDQEETDIEEYDREQW